MLFVCCVPSPGVPRLTPSGGAPPHTRRFSMSTDLSRLGWDEAFASAFLRFDRSDSGPGRVLRADRGVCTVLAPRTASSAPVARRARVLIGRGRRSGPPAVCRRLGGAAPLARPAHHSRVRAAPPDHADPPDRRQGLVRPGAGGEHGHRRGGRADAPGTRGRPDRAAARAGLGIRRRTGGGAHQVRHRGRSGCDRPADRRAGARGPGAAGQRRSAATACRPVRELVRPGRTLALLGRSGAGKSTLVNALAGASVMPVQPIRRARRQGPAHHGVPDLVLRAGRRRRAGHPRHPRRRSAGYGRGPGPGLRATSPSWPPPAGSATAGIEAEPGCAVTGRAGRRVRCRRAGWRAGASCTARSRSRAPARGGSPSWPGGERRAPDRALSRLHRCARLTRWSRSVDVEAGPAGPDEPGRASSPPGVGELPGARVSWC